MGLRSWMNKPAEPGSVKWHMQTGETDPVKVFKSSYEYKKQKQQEKLDSGEKVFVGKSFLILGFICAVLCLYTYPMFSSLVFAVVGLISVIFVAYLNIGDSDGESE